VYLTYGNFRIADRPRSFFLGTQSEDKIYIKDLCWSVRMIHESEGLTEVSTAGLLVWE
jgi:hypothetical protein